MLSSLEEARREGIIRHPYEAKVYIEAEGEIRGLLEKYEDYLNFFLTVSQVELRKGGEIVRDGEEVEGISIGVSHADGKKCPRCWIYFPEDEFEGNVCRRCCQALENMGYACT